MSTSTKSKAAKALVLCSLMLALTSGNTLPDGPKVSSSKVMPRSLPEFLPAIGQKKTTPTASPPTTPKAPTTTPATTPTTTPKTPTTPTPPTTPVVNPPTPTPTPTPEPEPPLIPEDIEPDQPKKTEVQIKFDYTNSFLAGFRSRETLPSATVCTQYLEQSMLIFEANRKQWNNETITKDWGTADYVFDTTHWISFNLAPASRGCYMTGLEVYGWVLLKQSQFDSFSSLFQAWLQNLLSNIITFNQLYKKIDEATKAENWLEVYYWYGRFTTLFINFEPIVEDEIDTFDQIEEPVVDKRLLSSNTDSIFSSFSLGMMAAQKEFSSSKNFERLLRTSSVNNQNRRMGPVVGSVMGSIYGFTSGYVNASIAGSAPNVQICQTNITRFVNSTSEFLDQVEERTPESLNSSATSFENILASVHPITFSCFMSGFEIEQAAGLYFQTLTSWQKVSFNLIHKLGNIYDTFFFLVRHQTSHGKWNEGDDNAENNWWFKLGVYYGTATYLIFYTPQETVFYDPMDGYTGLAN